MSVCAEIENSDAESRPRRRVILVTGASTGLGLALAKMLAASGKYFLIVTARRSSRHRFFEEGILEGPYVWVRDLDVTRRCEVRILFNEIRHKLGGIDVLVNNAGVSDRACVEDSSSSERQTQLNVNYLGPFDIITHALGLMRERGVGQIINVSSAGGFMAMPTMSAYSASKFALEGASESLWYEMRPWGIHVTLIIPGFIKSEGFTHTFENAKCRNGLSDPNCAYHQHYVSMKQFIARLMRRAQCTNEKIAKRIKQVINQPNPPLRVYVTLDARLLAIFRRVLPASVYFFVLYHLLPNVGSWGRPVVAASVVEKVEERRDVKQDRLTWI